MRNYRSDEPLTVRNPQARIADVACVDRDERFYETRIEPRE